ncbi:hypothetical protein [Halobacillus faecis]
MPEVPHINYLLEKESIAKPSTLNPFERVLLQYFENKCFYCENSLNRGQAKTQVDHHRTVVAQYNETFRKNV